jgi:hypothetical protein
MPITKRYLPTPKRMAIVAFLVIENFPVFRSRKANALILYIAS